MHKDDVSMSFFGVFDLFKIILQLFKLFFYFLVFLFQSFVLLPADILLGRRTRCLWQRVIRWYSGIHGCRCMGLFDGSLCSSRGWLIWFSIGTFRQCYLWFEGICTLEKRSWFRFCHSRCYLCLLWIMRLRCFNRNWIHLFDFTCVFLSLIQDGIPRV